MLPQVHDFQAYFTDESETLYFMDTAMGKLYFEDGNGVRYYLDPDGNFQTKNSQGELEYFLDPDGNKRYVELSTLKPRLEIEVDHNIQKELSDHLYYTVGGFKELEVFAEDDEDNSKYMSMSEDESLSDDSSFVSAEDLSKITEEQTLADDTEVETESNFESVAEPDLKSKAVYHYYTYTNTAAIVKLLTFLKNQYPDNYADLDLEAYDKFTRAIWQFNLENRQLPKRHAIIDLNQYSDKIKPQDRFSTFQIEHEGKAKHLKIHNRQFDSRVGELQATAQNFFSLLLSPNAVPDSVPVYDALKQRVGVISATFTDFESLYARIKNYYNAHKSDFDTAFKLLKELNHEKFYPDELIDELVQGGLIEVLVAQYFLGETDGHFKNIGFANGRMVRIDFDRTLAFFPALLQSNPLYDQVLVDGRGCALDKGFDIDVSDLAENFTSPKVAKPYRWIDANAFGGGTMHELEDNLHPILAEKIKNHPQYKNRKYTAFLKIILTQDEDFSRCVEPLLGAKMKDSLFEYLKARKQDLTEKLLMLDEFKEFLDSGLGIKQVLKEFTDYYQSKPQAVEFNNTQIQQRINAICERYYELSGKRVFAPQIEASTHHSYPNMFSPQPCGVQHLASQPSDHKPLPKIL